MSSVWSDNAPSRESMFIPRGNLAVREHYGFDKLNQQVGVHVVENNMRSACITLTELLKDVDDCDKELASRDARELVQLIHYLHHHLISEFKKEMDANPGGASPPFIKQYDILGLALQESLSRCTDRPSVATSRGLIELITRIIAQKCDTSLDLGMYQEKLSNLRVSK